MCCVINSCLRLMDKLWAPLHSYPAVHQAVAPSAWRHGNRRGAFQARLRAAVRPRCSGSMRSRVGRSVSPRRKDLSKNPRVSRARRARRSAAASCVRAALTRPAASLRLQPRIDPRWYLGLLPTASASEQPLHAKVVARAWCRTWNSNAHRDGLVVALAECPTFPRGGQCQPQGSPATAGGQGCARPRRHGLQLVEVGIGMSDEVGSTSAVDVPVGAARATLPVSAFTAAAPSSSLPRLAPRPLRLRPQHRRPW